MLNKEILKEFEKVVGKENINDGEVITQCYAYNWFMEVSNFIDDDSPSPFSKVPLAVILPSNTKEVQEAVRLCNKYNIKFKAQSTGLGAWNQPSTENCIIFDLKRMNKIIKIDVDNLYVVIEPYVSGAQLQAELMRFGLNCHISGAGPMVSPLASHTSMAGPGFTSPMTGHSARNVLGVEWVLPNGEVLHLGSLGLKNDPDWYIGDGPGPSLRGIMRGWIGAKSGIGIFTKVAIKLFPFPCEPSFKLSGHCPNYEFEIPKYLRAYVLECENFDKLEKVILRIEEEEIAFVCSFLSSLGIAAIFSYNTESLLENTPLATMKTPLLVVIAGRTFQEFDYKQEVMKLILEDFNIEDILENKFTPKSLFFAEALRCNLGFHGFISSLSFMSSGGASDTVHLCINAYKNNIWLKKKYIDKGAIADDFGEGAWGTTYEHGHFSHFEFPTVYDQANEYSIEGMSDYMENSNKIHLLKNLGAPFLVEGTQMHELFGPYMMDYHKWLRKIKEAFDPNDIADSGFYISPKRRTLDDFKMETKKKLRRWEYENENLDNPKRFKPLELARGKYILSIGRAINFIVSIFRPRKRNSNILILPPKKRKNIP
ncbi:MAG: FAD-binding oxidoreductase [Promethearchaeia archaeon]